MTDQFQYDLKRLMQAMQQRGLAFDKPITGYSPDEIMLLGAAFMQSLQIYNWQQAVASIGALHAATSTKNDDIPF